MEGQETGVSKQCETVKGHTMSHAPSRATSVAERRASATARQRQQQQRPASALLSPAAEDGRPSSQASHARKTSTTTETTRRRQLETETYIKRTISPLKPSNANNDQRSSRDVAPKTTPAVTREKENAEPIATSWQPTATLLPPTPAHAPLASRISLPPTAQHAPASVKPASLGGQTLKQQEKAIIDDLLFVLMGYEGTYITYSIQRQRGSEPYNPLDEKSRLQGPTYSIASGLDPSLRDLAQHVTKTAMQVSAIEAFVEVMSRSEYGSVSHALCAGIRRLLKDFLVLVAQLENQQLTNGNFSLHQLSLHLRASGHIMAQLYALAQEVLKENGLIGPAESDQLDEEDEDEFDNVLASLKGEPGASRKKSCIGGGLLALLTTRLRASSGDPQAKELLTTLLREASRPYVRMLNEWLHHGNVRDPHSEFMVKETKSIKRELLEQDYTDEYWEKRYTIKQDLVPPQLESVKDRVLLAGKYLNVVRECGGLTSQHRNLEAEQDLPHTFDHPSFLPNVNQAYTFANSALMDLLLNTHHLPQRLKSLKHYFFLNHSDWFTYFLELSHSELRKPAKTANVGKLQSLLDLVLHTPGSVAAEDAYKDDVRVSMADSSLTSWLQRVVNVQGMDADASTISYTHGNESVNSRDGKDKEISAHEALTLDLLVPFPLSLIVSRVTLTRYQLLFRYLLSLKHLESQLLSSWTEAGGMGSAASRGDEITARKGKSSTASISVWRRKATNAKIEQWKRRAWCLRSRMLTFVQQLLYFCTAEVIEPNWSAFFARLSRSEDAQADGLGNDERKKRTVDELMQDHVDFLATCLKECMLTNSKLLRVSLLFSSVDPTRSILTLHRSTAK